MLRAMKLFGKARIETDTVTLEPGSDGALGCCYFCGAPVDPGLDVAVLIVERLDPKGDPIRAACHGNCAARARRI